MGVIRRFVWGTMALGVLAILGGTSALAFDGGSEKAPAVLPSEQAAPWFSAASVPAADPSPVWRWLTPHTIPAATR